VLTLSRKDIKIRIIDDEEYEKDEEFYVFLGQPTEVDTTPASGDGPDPTAILGECCKTTVCIEECHEFKNNIGMYIILVIYKLLQNSFIPNYLLLVTRSFLVKILKLKFYPGYVSLLY